MYKNLKPVFFILILYSLTVTGNGQVTPVDSAEIRMNQDTLQVRQTSVWPALVRSVVVPGWGQIQQEHAARATVFYGLSVYLIYHLVRNQQQFEKTHDNSYRLNTYRYAILYAQIYTLNILDVLHSHVFRQDPPWPGELFSDIPMKSPWGAVARSAMLPGWGQLYNEKYFKSVIAFGICFDFARKVYVFNQRYQKNGRKYDLDRRVINSWYLGLFYMLNMVDAYVDAYLYKFDEIMDLTIQFSPLYQTPMIGVKFEL